MYLLNKKNFKPVKVKKAGKLFELLTSRIEEAIGKDEDVEVIPDHYIENLEGFKRQFDVYIISKINKYPIEIAVECKDYKDPISVDKLEAFQCKCERVPTINKKVFVSKTGYTKGAVAAAKVYGITLINLENVDSNEISKWVKPLELFLQKRFIKLDEVIAIRMSDGKKIGIRKIEEYEIRFEGYEGKANIKDFSNSYLISLSRNEWESNFEENSRNQPTNFGYQFIANVPMHIGREKITDQYAALIIKGEIWEENIKLNKVATNKYSEFASNESKANVLQLEGENDEKQKGIAEFILPKDSETITLNYSLIDGNKIVCTSSNTFYLKDILRMSE